MEAAVWADPEFGGEGLLGIWQGDIVAVPGGVEIVSGGVVLDGEDGGGGVVEGFLAGDFGRGDIVAGEKEEAAVLDLEEFVEEDGARPVLAGDGGPCVLTLPAVDVGADLEKFDGVFADGAGGIDQFAADAVGFVGEVDGAGGGGFVDDLLDGGAGEFAGDVGFPLEGV